MGSRTYLCYVIDNELSQRIYTVTHRSAMKAAEKYGQCNGSESVIVRTHSGQVLSKVKWDEESKKYINVSF